ncbi:MAG: imidazoleglycerol-phosphate dehydratase HisB [Oscillospiraceae bacterium]|nr:imidazoleglycerol-phosphate dehydratase HisB [Oscillospiraceae bacterium]
MNRTALIERKTKETNIEISLNLDDCSEISVKTGVGFFDHMLNSFAFHGGFGLKISCDGDLFVDGHHTVEDVGIVLGQCFKAALGDKKGITRFASAYIPMDEALAFCAADISGRGFLVFEARFDNERTGDFENCLLAEFLRAFALNAETTLHVRSLYGDNDHHKIEACFKAMAKALGEATTIKTNDGLTPSTKGVL